ncbi:MAG: hypothetical protein L3J74_17480 [Bacteroidales bacterium]|nr:hypothetical protein [Bacteroidales bacterium]
MELLIIGTIILSGGLFFAIRAIRSLMRGKDLDIDFGNMKFTGDSDTERVSTECSI